MRGFEYYNPVKSIFGRNALNELSNIIENNRVLILSDHTVSNLDYFKYTVKKLNEREGLSSFLYSENFSNPDVIDIDKAALFAARHKVNSILAIGGGSVLDAAKLVAVILSDADERECLVSASDYLSGERPLPEFGRLPLVLCPTTAGTGSEVTNVSVINDVNKNMKKSLVGNILYSDVSIIDPNIMESAPKRIIAEAGVDALMHAIECYWNKNSTPPSDALSMYAIKMLITNIVKVYNGNREDIEKIAIASYLAGLAFNTTRTTLPHSVGSILTLRYGVTHGPACALVLIPISLYNYADENIQIKIDELARYCGYENGIKLIECFKEVLMNLELPTKLSEYGVPKEDLSDLAYDILNGSYSSISKLNPRPVNESTMVEILESVY